MQITFQLCLPRDEASVPVVRGICSKAMSALGVEEECSSDIEIALTEACTNVLMHARDTDNEYEVTVKVDDELCEIRVLDDGGGFDQGQVPVAADDAESGRGIQLMQALTDGMRFESEGNGTVVNLRKKLRFTEGAPVHRLVSKDGSR